MPKKYYCVVQNMPGYLPDAPDENYYTASFADACEKARDRAAEWRDSGYRVLGNIRKDWMYTIPDADEVIEILDISEDDYTRETQG